MKNIVLVTPPILQRQMYGNMASWGSTMPSLGLLFLASYIRSKRFKPYVIDSIAMQLTLDEVVDRIVEINPKYVGISSTTFTIYNAARLAKYIKKVLPSVIIILGGCHITTLARETMKEFPEFDIGVIGEGEKVLFKFLTTLEEGRDVKNIEGLVFRENGTIIENKRMQFIEDLDTLPLPSWDLVPNFPTRYRIAANAFRKLPVATLVTSRGCPYECTFCDTSVFGKKVRAHSADYVIAMFKRLVNKYGIKEIGIYDDNFTVLKERLVVLCEKIIAEKLGVSWSCLTELRM